MSRIISHIEPREDNGNNTDMMPSYAQHNIELHSAMYALLHSACPPYPGDRPAVVSLVSNGLGGLPIVAEDGVYIVRN